MRARIGSDARAHCTMIFGIPAELYAGQDDRATTPEPLPPSRLGGPQRLGGEPAAPS